MSNPEKILSILSIDDDGFREDNHGKQHASHFPAPDQAYLYDSLLPVVELIVEFIAWPHLFRFGARLHVDDHTSA